MNITKGETVMNKEKEFLKLYAAFRSGCLGENVLNVYFSLFANILLEERTIVVEANELGGMFQQRYQFSLPMTFVRQVLSIGVSNGTISNTRGRYEVTRDKLLSYKIDLNGFESSWKALLEGFSSFCASNDFSFDESIIEDNVLEFINSQDIGIVLNKDAFSDESTSPFDFAWNRYLQHIASNDPKLFDFMSAVCFSNILKEAIFYGNATSQSFNGLNVYLDAPLAFSVLGMDDNMRVDSVRFLIHEMKEAGCNIHILDHNLAEVKGIIDTAGERALSSDYNIAKANNATKFFHDGNFGRYDVDEFLSNIETSLSEYGISIKQTSYDALAHEFQEDEGQLYEMIEAKYKSSGFNIPSEKEYSIKVDVRSIVILYRIRAGVVASTIQESKHIMITQNSAIANVCKNYESNRSVNSGHIPVCISADLFGTILWMHRPQKMIEYHRKQLLADCYSVLKPSKQLLDKYIQSLNSAKDAGEISETKYLFMRSHRVVSDALMNVTKGDYARFNDKTYLEIYDDIVAASDKKYSDEVTAHVKTKKQLTEQTAENDEINSRLKDLEKKEQARFDKMCMTRSRLWSIAVFGIPYFVILGLAELVIGLFQGFSCIALAVITGVLIIVSLLEAVRKKVFDWVYEKVRKHELTKEGRKPYDNVAL
jgi:hypothetical protein